MAVRSMATRAVARIATAWMMAEGGDDVGGERGGGEGCVGDGCGGEGFGGGAFQGGQDGGTVNVRVHQASCTSPLHQLSICTNCTNRHRLRINMRRPQVPAPTRGAALLCHERRPARPDTHQIDLHDLPALGSQRSNAWRTAGSVAAAGRVQHAGRVHTARGSARGTPETREARSGCSSHHFSQARRPWPTTNRIARSFNTKVVTLRNVR